MEYYFFNYDRRYPTVRKTQYIDEGKSLDKSDIKTLVDINELVLCVQLLQFQKKMGEHRSNFIRTYQHEGSGGVAFVL